MRPERADFRPKKADFRLEKADLRSERANLSLRMARGGDGKKTEKQGSSAPPRPLPKNK